MKHIKKYRKKFNRKELDSIQSKARQRAKTELSQKYKEEYLRLVFKHRTKIKRSLI